MTSATPRPWSTDEDSLLRDAVAQYSNKNTLADWTAIANCIPGRSNKACRKRWLHSLSPTLRKTPWTDEEDALLLKLYATHSPPRWALIAKSIPGRTDDACSKRYREALDPLLKRDDWTPDEDAQLMRLTTQLGSKWTRVGQAMGRSGLGCRNRWRLLERKRHRTSVSPAEPSHDPAPFANDHSHIPPSIPYHNGTTEEQTLSANDASFPEPSSLIHPPPPDIIFTEPSLDVTLVSALTSHPGSFHSVPINCTNSLPVDDFFELSHSFPSFPQHHTQSSPTYDGTSTAQIRDSCPMAISPSPPEHPGADPGTAPTSPAAPGPDPERPPTPPRKRARNEQCEPTRLSSYLPADLDHSVLAYACGHPVCWPGSTGHGTSCFATSSELAEHRRATHPVENPCERGKPYRCALPGCGKGWKNINGIQYHLQVSQAHFKAALSQTRVPSDASAAPSEVAETDVCISEYVPAEKLGNNTSKRKEFRCTHEGCRNSYKQRSGLQYHLIHGHPPNVAQLHAIPPVLMRKLGTAAPGH